MEAIAIFYSTNIRRNSLDILKIEEYHSEYTFGFLQKREVVFLIWVLNRKRNPGYKICYNECNIPVPRRGRYFILLFLFCFFAIRVDYKYLRRFRTFNLVSLIIFLLTLLRVESSPTRRLLQRRPHKQILWWLISNRLKIKTKNPVSRVQLSYSSSQCHF